MQTMPNLPGFLHPAHDSSLCKEHSTGLGRDGQVATGDFPQEQEAGEPIVQRLSSSWGGGVGGGWQ